MASSSMIYLENKIKEMSVEDNDFRKNLLTDPRGTLKKHMNVDVPADIEIKVVEDSAKTIYIVLPPVINEETVAGW